MATGYREGDEKKEEEVNDDISDDEQEVNTKEVSMLLASPPSRHYHQWNPLIFGRPSNLALETGVKLVLAKGHCYCSDNASNDEKE